MKLTEAEIRQDERKKCAEELRSLAKSHRACAQDDDGEYDERAAIHRAKADTIEYCAKQLLDWGGGPVTAPEKLEER